MTEGICPSGWHIPSEGEFTELTDFLGGESVAGGKMKSTYGWNNEGNGSNSSGFNGLPGGCRYSGGRQHWLPRRLVVCFRVWFRLMGTSTEQQLRQCQPLQRRSRRRLFCSLRPGLKILNYSDAVARWKITSRA